MPRNIKSDVSTSCVFRLRFKYKCSIVTRDDQSKPTALTLELRMQHDLTPGIELHGYWQPDEATSFKLKDAVQWHVRRDAPRHGTPAPSLSIVEIG